MAKVPGMAFVGSLIDEGRKVIWPNRETVVRHTLMVLLSVAVAAVFFGAVDLGLQRLVILAVQQ
jgi:preprotein translocase SecE subunit